MPNAVIVDAVRTPVGRRGGRLSGWHATDLAAQPLAALLARNDLDPSLVEDVVMGCTMTVGEQAMNIARNAALAAGFPESVPGTTVDRQCGSAQQAIHFAAQAVMAGAMDVAIGAGVESMSRVPIGSTTEPGPGEAYGPLYLERFELIHQGECAEEIARRWKITRDEMDEFALRSHQRAARATDEGRFANEIVPLEARVHPDVPGAAEVSGLLSRRRGHAARHLAREAGRAEAGLLRDGHGDGGDVVADLRRRGGRADHERGAGVVARPAAPGALPHLRRGGQRPPDHADGARSRPPSWCWPRRSSRSTTWTWSRSTRRSPRWCWPGSASTSPTWTKVNPNGGAIAIGHPTGCSGARLMATLLNEMERTGARYGLQTMCEGGGQANATIIERLG